MLSVSFGIHEITEYNSSQYTNVIKRLLTFYVQYQAFKGAIKLLKQTEIELCRMEVSNLLVSLITGFFNPLNIRLIMTLACGLKEVVNISCSWYTKLYNQKTRLYSRKLWIVKYQRWVFHCLCDRSRIIRILSVHLLPCLQLAYILCIVVVTFHAIRLRYSCFREYF